jgi:hypothetical protein
VAARAASRARASDSRAPGGGSGGAGAPHRPRTRRQRSGLCVRGVAWVRVRFASVRRVCIASGAGVPLLHVSAE